MATSKNKKQDDPRSRLASVTAILENQVIKELIDQQSRTTVMAAIQSVLARWRTSLSPADSAPDIETIVSDVVDMLTDEERDRIRRVVNATGIILHTGLGRAVLCGDAARALADLDGCCNLQVDLDTGRRGKRNHMCEKLLCQLTGAEAAVIVNNNAAATLLILTALCRDRDVIVSRGQLIEIGGSFRLPDCISQSGARMVEVGTTNKTHLRDYENAMSEDTAAILRVNPSNYRVVGFSQDVPIEDLAGLKKAQSVIVIDDLGCGALVDTGEYGLPSEPTVSASIAAGADIACFSADKLIGGPQAGIIVGTRELVETIRKHPLVRMLRVGKLTDVALEHTLRLFLDPDRLKTGHPTVEMLTADPGSLQRKAESIRRRAVRGINDATLSIDVVESDCAVGGGSMPTAQISSFALAVRSDRHSPDDISRMLRLEEPPVIARIRDDATVLDMRTLLKGDDKIIVTALRRITGET
jgi:L-seryl-tRNA(Ser) seleniumtransferase